MPGAYARWSAFLYPQRPHLSTFPVDGVNPPYDAHAASDVTSPAIAARIACSDGRICMLIGSTPAAVRFGVGPRPSTFTAPTIDGSIWPRARRRDSPSVTIRRTSDAI